MWEKRVWSQRRIWCVVSMLLLLGVGLTPRGGSAQEPDGQEAAAPTGAIRVVTVLVTKVSADRSLTVRVFPRVAEATRGDRVFWLNAIPGAVMSVLFLVKARCRRVSNRPTWGGSERK